MRLEIGKINITDIRFADSSGIEGAPRTMLRTDRSMHAKARSASWA